MKVSRPPTSNVQQQIIYKNHQIEDIELYVKKDVDNGHRQHHLLSQYKTPRYVPVTYPIYIFIYEIYKYKRDV